MIDKDKNRVIFLDYLRLIACFMVVIVHSCEFYYLGDGGIVFANPGDRAWVAWIDGALREAVPLFVMASSYLLLPLTCDTSSFFKRRFVRVFIPFAIWSILYAILPVIFGTVEGDIPARLTRLIYNFNDDSGHLWFIYMLIGVYLIMPIISPWLKQLGKKEELCFLGIWFATTFWGYLYPWLGDIWGKALWNDFHALYYYSGFIGYVVLAHYIKEHVRWSLGKTLAVSLPLIIIGYAITGGLFYEHTGISNDYSYAEQSWNFCTFNVAMVTTGCFLLFRHISYSKPWLYRPVKAISKVSYGIYLMHIFILGAMYTLLSPLFSTPVAIFTIAISTWLICIAIALLLRPLPFSRFLLG